MSSPRRISIPDLFQFAAACLLLAIASLAVRFLPFRALVRTMGWGGGHPDGSSADRASRSALAVRRASARLPWRTACLDQGLAAHWLMRSQGVPSILHYGIDPGNGELSAHVWVSFAGRILIGEEESGRHAEVTSFPARSGDRTG